MQEKGSKVRNVFLLILVKEEDSGQEGGHHTDADHHLLLLANILKLIEEDVDVKVGLPGIDKEDGNEQGREIAYNTKEEVDRSRDDKEGTKEDNDHWHYQLLHAFQTCHPLPIEQSLCQYRRRRKRESCQRESGGRTQNEEKEEEK